MIRRTPFLDMGFAGAVTLVGLDDLDGRSVYHLRVSPGVDILGDYSGFVGGWGGAVGAGGLLDRERGFF